MMELKKKKENGVQLFIESHFRLYASKLSQTKAV